jgi:hypothetical protein
MAPDHRAVGICTHNFRPPSTQQSPQSIHLYNLSQATMQLRNVLTVLALSLAGSASACATYYECKCHDSRTVLQNDAGTKTTCSSFVGATYSDFPHHQCHSNHGAIVSPISPDTSVSFSSSSSSSITIPSGSSCQAQCVLLLLKG